MPTSANYTIMSKAVRRAGRSLIRDYGEVDKLQVSKKGTMDFVTQADLTSEKMLREDLSKARPGYGFLLEEGGEVPGKDPGFRWVIDPLDGTTNFIHAIPYFCISVALEKKRSDGMWIPVAGLIHDPLRDEDFFAEEYQGTFVGSRRVQVSARHSLDDASIVTHSPKHDHANFKRAMDSFITVTGQAKGMRIMGATALDLAYIAAGRIDAGWYTSFKRWDISAGMLLIREAGGTLTQLDGNDNVADPATLLVGTPKLHATLGKLLAPHWR